MGALCCAPSTGEVVDRARSLIGGIRVPESSDAVFKDECVFTLDTPFSERGLCVNLMSWQGVAADMVDLDVIRTGGGCLYLVQKFRRVRKLRDHGIAKPTRLAIGTPGAFLEEEWEVVKEHSLLVAEPSGSRFTVMLPCEELPEKIGKACGAIMAHRGAKLDDETSRWEVEEELTESRHAEDLVQLPPTRKISPNPKDWACEKSGARENLWLNLSDGHIGGGRRFWDGSGGSNGALDHFNEEQAKGNFYPLVVKLGTITPQGAEVYSYAKDEDKMVQDPHLARHLEHWGIDVMSMEKTEKTLQEMEIEKNLSYDWSRMCESGEKALVRVRGPGLVGLKNLGNSCYLNSTLQLLLALPEAQARYLDENREIRRQAPPDVPRDLITQVAKLVGGLLSSRYAPSWREGQEEDDDPRLTMAPQMFRALIGGNHRGFSSNQQQDAGEFIQFFLDQLSRAERKALGTRLEAGRPFAALFEFSAEERLEENGGARRVQCNSLRQNMLSLPVKLDEADCLAEVGAFHEGQRPKPVVELHRCLAHFAAPEPGVSFRGAEVTKTVRLATMPRYLLVQLQRYYLDDRWRPNKLDCRVPMPERLSLEDLRGSGLQPGEVAWPDSPEPAQPAGRAGGGGGAGGAPTAVDPEAAALLVSMGFSEAHALAALAACDFNAERAADWLFSHSGDLDGALAAAGEEGGEPQEAAPQSYEDGPGDYELLGFISHIGRDTSHGHYVCHMRRGPRRSWVIFDDDKVALSEMPPTDLGYVYLYARISASA